MVRDDGVDHAGIDDGVVDCFVIVVVVVVVVVVVALAIAVAIAITVITVVGGWSVGYLPQMSINSFR